MEEFKFCLFVFDLWILFLVCCCILFGVVLGVLFFKCKMEVVFRIIVFKKFWFYYSVGVVVFVVIKFFVSMECNLDRILKIWFLLFLGWIVVGIVIVNGLWYFFFKIKIMVLFLE